MSFMALIETAEDASKAVGKITPLRGPRPQVEARLEPISLPSF